MSKIFTSADLSVPDFYKLLVGVIVPRPIGWISTVSASGVANLAPFSFFNMFGNNPPVLGFSAAIDRHGNKKHSQLNAEETKCFVHNVVTRDVLYQMNQTSYEYPREVSEFEKAGLTIEPSKFVRAPRVKEAVINIECELNRVVSFGNEPGNGQVVFGNVVAVHVNDESLLDDKNIIFSEKLEVISRLGRTDYLDFGPVLKITRPQSE